MTPPLLLIDAASLYFRAFYGVPVKGATAPNGQPVNAVRGFMDMLATLIRTRGADKMVCALDYDWRPAWRVALIPSYKAHRVAEVIEVPKGEESVEEIPDDLTPQIEIIIDLLEAMGIAAVGSDGFEAEDVIGTIAARSDGVKEVATGDRDLFTVIDDERSVRVLYCGRGVGNLEVMDGAALYEKAGVWPKQYPFYAALRGDPSDGLPGIPGIGPKTAAALVARYENIDALANAAADPRSEMTPRVRGGITSGLEYLHAALQVIAVQQDISLPSFDSNLLPERIEVERVAALGERFNLGGPTQRLVEAIIGKA